MIAIPLSNNGMITVISEEDACSIAGYTWYAEAHHNTYYARAYVPKSNNKKIYMHRLLMGKPPTGQEIDHKDRYGLHNTRRNLRFVSPSLNRRNSKLRKNNTTGYCGVWKNPRSKINPYIAEIRVNGRRRHLGCFPTPELASAAYQQEKQNLAEQGL